MENTPLKQDYILVSDETETSGENNVFPVQIIANVSIAGSEGKTSSIYHAWNGSLHDEMSRSWPVRSLMDSDNKFVDEAAKSAYSPESNREEVAMDESSFTVSSSLDSVPGEEPDSSRSQRGGVPYKIKRYKCSRCVYRTCYKSDLNRHTKKHDKYAYSCDVCKMPFMTEMTIMHHRRKHHPSLMAQDAVHPCTRCSFESVSKEEFESHVSKHVTASFFCNVCNQVFEKKTTMEWHKRKKHNVEKDRHFSSNRSAVISKMKNCMQESGQRSDEEGMAYEYPPSGDRNQQIQPYNPNCQDGELFHFGYDKQELACSEHVTTSDERCEDTKPIVGKFMCKFCSKRFGSKLVLKYHCWHSHKEQVKELSNSQVSQGKMDGSLPGIQDETTDDQLTLNARETTYQEKNQLSLLLHFEDALPPTRSLRYQCPLCSFDTCYKSTMDRHVKKHSEAKYSCEICGMPFTVIGNLYHHKKVHHPEILSSVPNPMERHKCSLCIYSTSYKSTLERHLRTHGIAKYHCEMCNMPFVFAGSLITHRKLKHQLCEREFVETVFMEESETSGKGPRRRKCPYCSVSTLSASKLNRHLRSHKNAGYYCGNCSLFFALKKEFEVHMQEHLSKRWAEAPPFSSAGAGETSSTNVGRESPAAAGEGPDYCHLFEAEEMVGRGSQETWTSSGSYVDPRAPSDEQCQNMGNEGVFDCDVRELSVKKEADSQPRMLGRALNNVFLAEEEKSGSSRSGPAGSLHTSDAGALKENEQCSCKLIQPVHGEILSGPPYRGRYAKLVSDFDDFATRPFACSLCFFRCSVLKDLFYHVQNHLTGCSSLPLQASSKFDAHQFTENIIFCPSSGGKQKSNAALVEGSPGVEFLGREPSR